MILESVKHLKKLIIFAQRDASLITQLNILDTSTRYTKNLLAVVQNLECRKFLESVILRYFYKFLALIGVIESNSNCFLSVFRNKAQGLLKWRVQYPNYTDN